VYVADLVGIDTVGFGSDYDGFSSPPIVPDVSQLVLLTQAMLARGLTEEEIRKFWGGNFLRVFSQTIDKPLE
jgi:membrane dipeptidase